MNYLFKYESELWGKGVNFIAGVDEAGRGPLAGPLVVSAVILKKEVLESVAEEIQGMTNALGNYDVKMGKSLLPYTQINDSKKLSEKKREELFKFIKTEAHTFSIIEISHKDIDQQGILPATEWGFLTAVKELKSKVEHVLTDHVKVKNIPKNQQTNITKGDSLSINIAAASILAKVYRDNLMREYAKQYPKYGFEKHKGYGTKKHREAIFEHGPCDIHRRSFNPIKSMPRRQA